MLVTSWDLETPGLMLPTWVWGVGRGAVPEGWAPLTPCRSPASRPGHLQLL